MHELFAIKDSWRLGSLLRGDPGDLLAWVEGWGKARIAPTVLLIGLGAGLYGGAMGCWRSPAQALLVALKFPLIILFTTLCNGLLNAMLAPLLGLKSSLRVTIASVSLSFVIAAAILGSFSPLVFFLVWNGPALSQASAGQDLNYSLMLLLHVGVIALAGVIANLRLAQLLGRLSGNARVTRRVLFAWLAGNLFVGSQISWILRPFIGSPDLPVEFVRHNAFQGNFYEAVFNSFMRVLNFSH